MAQHVVARHGQAWHGLARRRKYPSVSGEVTLHMLYAAHGANETNVRQTMDYYATDGAQCTAYAAWEGTLLSLPDPPPIR